MTKSQKEALRTSFKTYEETEDPICHVKLFNPVGRGTWWLMTQDPEDPDYLWCAAELFEDIGPEVGSVSLSELESISGFGGLKIERDLHYKPMRLSEILEARRKVCNA